MLKYLAFFPVANALSPACERELSALQCVKACDTYTKYLGFTRGSQSCSESIAEDYINRQCCDCGNAGGDAISLVHDPDGAEEYVEPVCGDAPVYPLESGYNAAYANAAYGGFDAGWVKRPEAASFYLLWNNFVANPQGVNLVAPSLANKLLLNAVQRADVNSAPNAYPYLTHPDDDEKYNELMTMKLGELDVLRVKICDTDTQLLEQIETPSDIIVNVYTAYDGASDCAGTWYCSRHDYEVRELHKVGECADIVVPLGNVDHPNIMADTTNQSGVTTASTGSDYTSKNLLAVALNTNSASSNKPVYKIKSYQINDIEVTLN